MRKIKCKHCGQINTFGKEAPQVAEKAVQARFRVNGVVYLVSGSNEGAFLEKHPNAERL